jgi:hypothetical protein
VRVAAEAIRNGGSRGDKPSKHIATEDGRADLTRGQRSIGVDTHGNGQTRTTYAATRGQREGAGKELRARRPGKDSRVVGAYRQSVDEEHRIRKR